MTKKQFKKHLKEHGITKARTTEELYSVPKGTELWFGLNEKLNISTYDDDTRNKNKAYNYDFDYEWFWDDSYTGKFELVEEETSENIIDALYNSTLSNGLIKSTKIADVDQNYFILPKSNYTLEQTEDLFIIKEK